MPRKATRREFLGTSALAGVGVWVAGSSVRAEDKSPNERIRFACIGVGGKGSSDSSDAGKHGDVVAICDIDEQRLGAAAKRFPHAKQYVDFRKMFDEMRDSIDAVTVSTADHTHAAASVMAMRLGKHCFCQKPLTHTLFEARTMATVAREMKVVTQMGNQGTSESGVRKAAKIIQAGALGSVKEVHVWTNRPIWPQGGEAPAPAECPKHVHWDLWLGPAKDRPYAKGYHPFAWRGWWDFGTGALGDMACHTANMPFMALDLRDPVSVQAETSGHNQQSYPKWSIIKFEFAGNDKRGPVNLTWYDGGKLPEPALLDGKTPSESGAVIIGEKGKLFSPNDYGAEFELLGGVTAPEVEFTASPGHFQEYVDGIKGGPAPVSNFSDYAGPLTETILLGNLAVWADGKKIEWDAKNLAPTNAPEVAHIVKTEYRSGWTL